MIMNFFKIQIVDVDTITDPAVLAVFYLKNGFFKDLLAVFPWASVKPYLLIFRYLNITRMSNY